MTIDDENYTTVERELRALITAIDECGTPIPESTTLTFKFTIKDVRLFLASEKEGAAYVEATLRAITDRCITGDEPLTIEKLCEWAETCALVADAAARITSLTPEGDAP